ncbi:MAG: carbamoyl-phosphate synthase (glutamine-hydrolyzing) large subunit [Nitrospirae bacterium]|nr:MAG: carbamoyl-phosphate synthase (glutamine-hydrolyzing) large subunit [Nitrospirota bacterium]
MPSKPKKVLLLGSAALKIGEAGEFDYSGSQAIKALKDEGISTILVNPNIATIQTSDHLAEKVYFLPVNAHFVERIIDKETPDGILLGFGGQTALNCGLELAETGILKQYGVTVLGTSIQAVRETEDRGLFVKKLTEIGVKVPASSAATCVSEAVRVADEIGYPVMLRIAYALGGLGSGMCVNQDEVRDRATKAFAHSRQILIEEFLKGWKEVEYEVVRDSYDNCITVCNMENLDPMGIHTGESIVVAPSQTLSNSEYHLLRQIAIRVVRHLGIIGECNIQFALDPNSGDYRVIEVNARLSRSSALASKATGYPLAYIATKLALGYSLTELQNPITKVTQACFEPALDYVVVKIPRWDLQKFRGVQRRIGSAMKSVGEVMAIARTFEEALQKALRMLQTGVCGLVGNDHLDFTNLEKELSEPTPSRIFAIAEAIKRDYPVERIYELSRIDKWFLSRMQAVVDMEKRLRHLANQTCTPELLLEAKQMGFSDLQIAGLTGSEASEIRQQRIECHIGPCVKQIDTLAAEYPAQTNYLYLTYNGTEDDIRFGDKKSVMVLGSGAYCIGSSVEFDWCCVNAVRTLRDLNYTTIIVNYNPETVSTDYNECDKLYFDELSFETLQEIYARENPVGIVLSMGGQIPNDLAMQCHEAGMRILGTSSLSIDIAEDRQKFSKLLEDLGIDQPDWRELVSLAEAEWFANKVGYPVLVRPSYVLSGAAMSVACNDKELERCLAKATELSRKHPVVISKFVENAKEVEIDAVANHGDLVVWAISEHVENAGVHSGDATLVLPPQRLYIETMRRIKKMAKKIAKALKIHGPFNIQFIAKDNDVKVIECNLRASRSFPFVSKILRANFIDIATRVMTGQYVSQVNGSFLDLDYVGVKAPQFSFTRLEGADPILGVEMTSTGEVACLGDDFDEAFLKSLLAVGYPLSIKNVLLSTGPVEAKAAFLQSARVLKDLGATLYATSGTAEFLRANGLSATVLHWPLEGTSPNTIEYLSQGKIDLVINIPKNYQEEELTNDYLIRRRAADFSIPLITNIQLAQRFVEALARKCVGDLQIKSWEEYRTPTGLTATTVQ